jgi:crossover junction endodeoxyribonuclease RusA
MIRLPFPPSINRVHRTINGRPILSKRGREYYDLATPLAAASGVVIRGPYLLVIKAHRPDRRKRDIGNLEKIVSDTLTKAGVIEDDCLAEAIISSWACSGVSVQDLVERSTNYPIIHVELGESK